MKKNKIFANFDIEDINKFNDTIKKNFTMNISNILYYYYNYNYDNIKDIVVNSNLYKQLQKQNRTFQKNGKYKKDFYLNVNENLFYILEKLSNELNITKSTIATILFRNLII